MIIYVDIDNTICKTNNSDYINSIPLLENINIINNLFDKGHTIIYWTARGGNSKKDYTELTKTQLLEWNCKYTELKMNKPSYDIFIDDKALTNIKDILKIIDI